MSGDDLTIRRPELFLIGLFDVLGFSGWLAAKGLDRVVQTYGSLIRVVVDKPNMRFGRYEPRGERHVITHLEMPGQAAYFSDTILVWVPLEEQYASAFLAMCADLMCEALALDVPLRGALAAGTAVMDAETGTYIGEPLVEAARLHASQLWVGAALAPSMESVCDAFDVDHRLVRKYDIPIKPEQRCRFIPSRALDWPARWHVGSRKADAAARLDALNNEEPYAVYYTNARDFVAARTAGSASPPSR